MAGGVCLPEGAHEELAVRLDCSKPTGCIGRLGV
jgi:hypothetical protein